MTKKQERAEVRIRRAKHKRERRSQAFVFKVAVRRLNNPMDRDYLMQTLCCLPSSLEMPMDEFLSKGQKLVGGVAVFFDRRELRGLLPNWTCSAKEYPTVLMVTYIEQYYGKDGRRKNTGESDYPTSDSSSRDSSNWA